MLEATDHKETDGSTTHRGMPLVYDSGETRGLTPFYGDFIITKSTNFSEGYTSY